MTVAERIQRLKAVIEADRKRADAGQNESPINRNKIVSNWTDWAKKDDFYNRPPGWPKFDNFKN